MTDTQGFQASATHQGRAFEEAVITILRISGWEIVETHAKVECLEIDIIAMSPDGTETWIECKGSWRGATPGSKRGDTVKKAVGVAAFLSTLPDEQRRPYLLVTSHLPNEGTVSHRLLMTAWSQGWFSDVKVVGFGGFPVEEVDD